MKKTLIMVLFVLLCSVWTVPGQQSGSTKISIEGGEPAQRAKEKKEQAAQPLTNDSIVKLVKAGLGEDTIIKMVDTQPGKYSLGADDIIALKTAGVSEKIIAAILNKSASAPAPASVAPASVAPARETGLNSERETTNQEQPSRAVNGTGRIKGTLTYYFNANFGNKPDAGARIMLVSGRVETPDDAKVYLFMPGAAYFGDSDTATLLNELVVDGKTYYAVKSTLADGNGNFELADIPSGESFESEFQRHGQEVARKVEAIAASETVQRIALEINRSAALPGGSAPGQSPAFGVASGSSVSSGGADSSAYPAEARSLAVSRGSTFWNWSTIRERSFLRRNGRRSLDIRSRRLQRRRDPRERS